ncbi:palmitoyltransferase [Tulasnella sp. 408]|nr:palmitoyltransferase [Tulasnella sp. 408]
MVKVFSLAIIHVTSGQGVELSSEQELGSFSFYQKTSVGEFMKFMSKTVAERTGPGQRQSVQEGNYIAHAYNRGGDAQLVSVMITDTDYPVRPAFSLLSKILDEYATAVPEAQWSNPPPFPATKEYLSKYQDPKQADNIMKVQAELDETKIILVRSPFYGAVSAADLTVTYSIRQSSPSWSAEKSWITW